MMATELPSKASLVLAFALREKIEDVIRWPVLAVAPDRDFVYLCSASRLRSYSLRAGRRHADAGIALELESVTCASSYGRVQLHSAAGMPRVPQVSG
jgi:hypothetical protein